MLQRGIDSEDVLRILRKGDVEGDPIEGRNLGEWKVKVTLKLASGRVAGVVTLLIWEELTLRLLTAEWEDHR
jgi:hypothetical protein